MRTVFIAFFLAGCLTVGICSADDDDVTPQPVDMTTPAPEDPPPDQAYTEPSNPDQAYTEPSNWEKFKAGAKLAGSAVASGTKNAASKTANAVVHGARKTGEFFSDGYRDAKEYIHEKTE